MLAAHLMFRVSMENPSAAYEIVRAISENTMVSAYPLLHISSQCPQEEILAEAGLGLPVRLSCYRFANKIFKIPHRRRRLDLPFDSGIFGLNCSAGVNLHQPDIVHLHWIADGRMSLRALREIHAPIVWTMHDVWPLTGGCHCNLGCSEWLTGCQQCLQLGHGLGGFTASALSWNKKREWYGLVRRLTPVAPSRWLGEMARKSPLFEGRSVRVIPNCVDGTIFCPGDKISLRRNLGIQGDAKVLIFGAADVSSPYKGWDLLIETLQRLFSISREKYHLLIFGNSSDLKFDAAWPITNIGYLDSKKAVAKALQAADVFIGPSRQDNLPTIYLEAIACGLPCIGFAIGGIPEIIRHKENGYIAAPFDCYELAQGIMWLTEDSERYSVLSHNARAIYESEYAPSIVGKAYADLYDGILADGRQNL